MRRMVLLAAMVAVAALMLAAAPAFADERSDWDHFCDWNDCNHFCDWNDCNHFFDNNGGINQANEQEVESGDATQTFNVVGGGDNSNQIVGVQGVNNTGNAVSNTSVFQGGGFDTNNTSCDFFNCGGFFDCGFFDCGSFGGSRGGEVEIEDSGNFTISPSQTVSGTQQINQTASASTQKWPWR
jgi:hypothetical protein